MVCGPVEESIHRRGWRDLHDSRCFPIFHEAYKNIAQRRMTIELSMATVIVAALAIREVISALIEYCYNDARVMKWVLKQGTRRFQGVTGSFDD